jgi:hypothetical protein
MAVVVCCNEPGDGVPRCLGVIDFLIPDMMKIEDKVDQLKPHKTESADDEGGVVQNQPSIDTTIHGRAIIDLFYPLGQGGQGHERTRAT